MEKRKILAIAVFALGALGAFFILSGPKKTAATPSVSILPETAGNLFQYPGFDGTQKIGGSGSSSTNFTTQLAQQYIRGFVQENPDGPTMIGGAKGLKTPSISEQLADPELVSKIALSLTPKLFEAGDVRSISDSGDAMKTAYFTIVSSLEAKDFPGTPRITIAEALDAWVMKQNTKPSEDLVLKINKHTQKLLEVSVPSSLVPFHLQMLNTWAHMASLFTSLSDLNIDPLKSIVAFREISLVVNDFIAIEKSITEKTLSQ